MLAAGPIALLATTSAGVQRRLRNQMRDAEPPKSCALLPSDRCASWTDGAGPRPRGSRKRAAAALTLLLGAEGGVPKGARCRGLPQRIFNSFVYTEKISNGESEVQQLAKKIREKFNRYLDVVNRNKQVVEASYTAHLTSPLTAIQDCCTIPPSMMEFDGNFNTNVSRTISCDRLSTTVNSRAFNPGRDLNSGRFCLDSRPICFTHLKTWRSA
nr:PREDICTED: VWFA and cache domain-containing protein 1-like [Apteryx mantelli mantelli]